MRILFVQKGVDKKMTSNSFSNTLQMAVFCFPGAMQALKMGDKGSQWVKANS